MKHPNAAHALAYGSGAGALVAWLLNGVGGLHVPAEGVAAISGGIAALRLWIGQRGLRGALREIWRGPE